jgi:hypothetical protein
MKKGDWIVLIIIALVLILSVAGYFSFFFYYSCDNAECFYSHQKECAKTKFINYQEDANWEYIIKGKSNGKCEIEVKITQIKQGDISRKILEGKSMMCYIPLGTSVSPESDISRCHGELKEEMQNLIIQNLHSYIVDNIGEITQELRQELGNLSA